MNSVSGGSHRKNNKHNKNKERVAFRGREEPTTLTSPMQGPRSTVTVTQELSHENKVHVGEVMANYSD